jgi:RNA polymerase sigma factor (sigma-70 family)
MGDRVASDADLVARCRSGDDDAWRALVDAYARYVHAIVTRVYGLRGPDAEDAFQEVFLRVVERLHTLRDPDALRPWIAQTARRCCVDRIRARGGGDDVLVDTLEETAAADQLALLDEALDVRRALAELGPDCAEVLDRFFCRDESYHRIAAALDLPSGTIASRISRCLTKLRALLDPAEGRKLTAGASRG